MSEPGVDLTSIQSASTLPEFSEATTFPTREKLFEEQQRVISEWIDDINKVDISLGGRVELYDYAPHPILLIDRMNPKYPGGWKDMLKGRKFTSAGVIYGGPDMGSDSEKNRADEAAKIERARNVFFGTLNNGTKVLEMVRIVAQDRWSKDERCSISTEPVTDKNKTEVLEIVTDRINKIIKERKEQVTNERLSSIPKVELPQT